MNASIVKIFLFAILSLNLYATDEQEIQELRDQVKMILQRIDALEKRTQLKVQNRADKVLVKSVKVVEKEQVEFKPAVKKNGLLELRTANTVLSIGGRIQLDINYDWPESGHSAKGIPIGDTTGENGELFFNSKESRLWVKTRTPSEYGPIRSLVEIDFNGSAGTETNTNSSNLRLRHAYVQVGNWVVGQTNSAFNTHTTLDILYRAINDVFVRQPLIRYTKESEEYSYDISFEQPETTLVDTDGKIITPKDDVAPDIIARFRFYPTWGELGISIMGRYINQNHAQLSDGTDLNNRDSAFGWAANVSGKVNVFEQDDIRFAAHYGEGLGRYIAYNAYAAASVDTDGKIRLQPSFGAHIGYRHWWNNKLRSTLSFSYTGTKNNMDVIRSVAARAIANKDAYSSQVNLIWIPVPNSLIGIEYAKAYREVLSGEKGELDTAMMRFRYDF